MKERGRELSLLEKADLHYAALKAERGLGIRYTAPEALTKIQSDQVKAVLIVLQEELGKIRQFINGRRVGEI